MLNDVGDGFNINVAFWDLLRKQIFFLINENHNPDFDSILYWLKIIGEFQDSVFHNKIICDRFGLLIFKVGLIEEAFITIVTII